MMGNVNTFEEILLLAFSFIHLINQRNLLKLLSSLLSTRHASEHLNVKVTNAFILLKGLTDKST